MLHRAQTFKKSQIIATRSEAILFFYLSLTGFLHAKCEDIDKRMSFREKFAVGYRIFGLIVVLLMIALGAFLLLGHYFDYVPWNIRIAFALLLLSVGAFRIVNIGLKYKKEKDEKEDI
jgi:uncharacterized protein YacL